MTSPWRIVTRTGWTSAAAVARAVVVSGRLNDEFGTTSGAMSSAGQHPLRLVEPAGHPAGQARPGLIDLGIAQLGP